MPLRSLLALSCFIASPVMAVDLLPIPAEPIGSKKEILFADDFHSAALAAVWQTVVPKFTVESGVLKGSQIRDKADGTAHTAVQGLEVPTKDSIVETRIRFSGASMIDVEFDDRSYTGSHYGHLCCAQVRLDGVTILDQRDGTQSNAVAELKKNPAQAAKVAGILAAHSVTYPAHLAPGKWYALGVETVGDAMRVTLDGRPAAFFKSPGIGHATKSKIELGVAGRDGCFAEIKVWNAGPSGVALPSSIVSNAAANSSTVTAAAAANTSGAMMRPDQPLLETLSQQAPNASAWVLAPLDAGVPPDIRQNVTYLREDLLDEAARKPKASPEAYKIGEQLCNTMIATLDERDGALARAGFRAIEVQAQTGVTSQALEARRNYMMSWPQFAREKAQRAELKSQAIAGAAVMAERPKLDWTNRTEQIRPMLDKLYAQFRAALRQPAVAK